MSIKKTKIEVRNELKFVIKNKDKIIDITDYSGIVVIIQVQFDTISQMEERYVEWKKVAHTTNFGGNPFENNSYIEIEDGNYQVIVSSPKYINGDSNWYDYLKKDNDNLKTIASISVFEK